MDPILYWNDVALEANRVSHTNGLREQTGPPLSARALAIVHLAVYDAFSGASGNPANLPPYLAGLPPAPAGASASAAVAAAAHTTLSSLFPSQEAAFDAKRASAPVTGTPTQVADGESYGTTVGQALLAERATDPNADSTGHVPSSEPGHHRVDPDDPNQGFHAPIYGARAKCFAAQRRHGLDKPPMLTDNEYRQALKQVRAKGISPALEASVPPGQRRTQDETHIGLFWAYDGAKGLGTPPRLYNQIIRVVAEARSNDAAANARLFAMVNAAMADAGVLAWQAKYDHDLWRPVVGVRENAGSPGSKNGDGSWLPLGAPRSNEPGAKNFTPPFPAYPSGHATFGAAAFQIVRRFYGVRTDGPDQLFDGLSFVSEELNGVTTDNQGAVRPRIPRTFPEGLWGMIRENSLSRVFLGVHWVFDAFLPGPARSMTLTENMGGVPLGLAIANDIFSSGLKQSHV